jgi:(1->4)-alpha-D-glucan 1-alpha-D-glucosylmutase
LRLEAAFVSPDGPTPARSSSDRAAIERRTAPAELTASRPDSARIPRATYRWQFNRGFTFQQARALLTYLDDLGISDVYASPYLQASRDSSHGYDVANHRALNPAIGTRAEYDAFAAELRRLGLGQLLDIVPNHMGIAEPANRWWMDLLENGPASPYASYFDITWDPPQPQLRDRVLLPILGDQYGVVLENGELELSFEQGAFLLGYYQARLPIAPDTYPQILQSCLGALAAELEPADERLVELQAINTAFGRLPPRDASTAAQVEQRQAEKETLKQRLAELAQRSPEVRAAIEATLRVFNGAPGQPASFDLLDTLLAQQSYRLAFWRVASEEINYRRFFDVNSLAAVRVEREAVFRATHELVLELLANGSLTGLRIDHPDGLWDPAAYLRLLQRSFLALGQQPPMAASADVLAGNGHRAAAEAEPSGDQSALETPLYVVVEKILSRGEQLRPDWAVHGTTGYDFANAVGGLFVDRANRRAFDDLYARFIGRRLDFHDLTNSTRKMIMLISLASEINALAHRLNQISEQQRRLRDFTLNSLTFVIREVIAALPIYRTYATCDRPPAGPGAAAIEQAVAEARRRNPRTDPSIFDFLRDMLLLRYPAGSGPQERDAQCSFVMKFQQTSGPVMAKGVEDTAFYVYNRLVSLNEVGGEPSHFGLTTAEFHRLNAQRAAQWPHSLLATSTHDTKRSEDVRARISVLSELPREFASALGRWSRLNSRHRARVGDQPAPDRNDEYLIYQTLLGAWPLGPLEVDARAGFTARIQAYLEKATREAKVHTSWINPNAEYDQALRGFIGAILDERRSGRFLESFAPLQRQVAHFGMLNSLAQVLLKLSSPGVPDIYQGNELWDLSLVDPDNRRPVDYELRQRLLQALRSEIGRQAPVLGDLAEALLRSWPDGRVKLYLTHRALDLRRRRPDLFRDGAYRPLSTEGPRAEHVCAFARECGEQALVAVAPRLLVRLVGTSGPGLPLGGDVWGETRLDLGAARPGDRFRDAFTGAILEPEERDGRASLALAALLARFPVALLERVDA